MTIGVFTTPAGINYDNGCFYYPHKYEQEVSMLVMFRGGNYDNG